MILILGGTTEGRIAVKTLEEAGKPFYYSTKGDEQEVLLHNGIRLNGTMGTEKIKEFCVRHNIKLLIDAAHPFAEQLHKTLEQVSRESDIPVIRFERIFPERDEKHINWCKDYDDAISQIKTNRISTLLALTGVQSISKLTLLWKGNTRCYFRILDRDSSRELANKQGYPEEYLHYYHYGEDERKLMQQIHPEAILIKESGISGGFCEKVKAAQELGIRIFAICRPKTSDNFHYVNGEHGLRRMVEKSLPDFFTLHSGLTTGTCAAAAAVAATWDIFNTALKKRPSEFSIVLPNGETIPVPVEPQRNTLHSNISKNGDSIFEISATVIKDAGDDPDITNGMKVVANVAIPFHPNAPLPPKLPSQQRYDITVCGGEGIGIITMPGLGLDLGAPAINATPRKMIEDNVKRYLKQMGIPQHPNPIVITISVPGGEEIAKRTFNPRLGIIGGISIIGTSGIVKPFSSEAFVSSIHKSMEVACAANSPHIVISSGAKSEKYIKAYYPDLPAQAFVHYGNFIGETLNIANELKLPQLTLGLMIGKAVKLAEGSLDTHSKKVVMNKDFIQDIARQAGCNEITLTLIRQMNMARELWDIIPPDKLSAFSNLLIEHCQRHCTPLLPKGKLTILLITENGNIYT
ncbi:cobalt-precorrin-5B (C(1))-methyltransferase CbiD [Bacteroides helcogenes]|uniref:Cobalt-precorrin-5B C(1)-methyltransferase n=1 Tax=Bacteroides helcogenes (strain ATCC 35417 / DSM 20613 / JCM 6297 / CCUG 15421 / P 36-108) TaxID=693979 RepID=E6SSV1_BACT6|nr:cobalt-precorrin-5B (C(1))-methyltransferase CbiD [Bacteroides helcogenes]ADV44182.1 cobalamin (vitamin B12) biosynthesis CbiD protein [Bacteroides helcogenes P 36-108]MDY5238405.1 cobalt-precorrin-5B (C(1))-methyltransferase CbiD [Bacteroides helcogenes]